MPRIAAAINHKTQGSIRPNLQSGADQVSRARAKSCASNGRRSSSCSPIPISLTGIPSSLAIARAIPPLAVPSPPDVILVLSPRTAKLIKFALENLPANPAMSSLELEDAANALVAEITEQLSTERANDVKVELQSGSGGGPASRARPTWAGSASASSGTWA